MYSAALFLSFRLLAGRRPVFLLALLAVASLSGGLDLLGMVATGVAPESAPVPSLDIRILYNLEWWGVPFAPQSLTMNLFYAPQHFFGALIGTALLCASLRSDQPLAVSLVEVVIIIAASVFWSPYVAVGLAVLAVVLLFGLDEQGTFFRRMKQEGFAALLPLRGLVSGAFAIALIAGRRIIPYSSRLFVAAPFPCQRREGASLESHLRDELRAAPCRAGFRLLARGLEGRSHRCARKPRTPSTHCSNTSGRALRKRRALARDAWPVQ